MKYCLPVILNNLHFRILHGKGENDVQLFWECEYLHRSNDLLYPDDPLFVFISFALGILIALLSHYIMV